MNDHFSDISLINFMFQNAVEVKPISASVNIILEVLLHECQDHRGQEMKILKFESCYHFIADVTVLAMHNYCFVHYTVVYLVFG